MNLQKQINNFNNLNNLFDTIQKPLSILLSDKNISKKDINDTIDLNISNFRKYYPIISSQLYDNEIYRNDLFDDFMEINNMSKYIFDIIEEILDDDNPFTDNIYSMLLFVDILLADFHDILTIKNEVIKNNLSGTYFNNKYDLYKQKLEYYNNIFIDNYFNDVNPIKTIILVKKIMSKEFIDENK